MSDHPIIQFDTVTKKFGNHEALSKVTFSIHKGEFVFLVGPSGSGKTTILRLLMRQIDPDAGKILFDTINIATLPKNKVPFLRRKIGIVFQDFKILMDRTVAENIGVTLEIHNVPHKDSVRRIVEVSEVVGLSHKKHQFPAQLSAGELQRVAIARALVGGPKMLLADEPTGNLDPHTSWEIMKILQEINSLGTTIVMATHNTDVVNKMKKRVISLDKGKLVKDEKEGKYN